jgi:cobalt-zinc-cadmium efflux system outer membrane protein
MRLLFVVLCLCSSIAHAEKLSLAATESLWREHSRELKLANEALGGAEADIRTAGQRPNPDVSLNAASISPWSGYGGGGWKNKEMDTILRIDQLIERGGKRDLRIRGAEARRDAAKADADEVGRQQLGDLHSAYFALRLAQEKLDLARETASFYGRGVEIGRLRLKAGDVAPVDVSRLEIDRARADADLRQSQADLEQAQIALAYLIGREAEAATLVAADEWPSLDESAIEAKIPENRPDLDAARKRVAAAEADRDLARALKKRDVTVGVQVEHNLQNAPTNSYGFGISIPLFVWHEHEGEIARAESDYSSARIELERQQAQVVGQVGQARAMLLSARDRCRRIEGGVLASAESVAKAAELAYAKGAMGLMDLLDARRTLRQIRIEAATARADYAMARTNWLLQTTDGWKKQ